MKKIILFFAMGSCALISFASAATTPISLLTSVSKSATDASTAAVSSDVSSGVSTATAATVAPTRRSSSASTIAGNPAANSSVSAVPLVSVTPTIDGNTIGSSLPPEKKVARRTLLKILQPFENVLVKGVADEVGDNTKAPKADSNPSAEASSNATIGKCTMTTKSE